ncbi:MAG: hypothetical protein ACI9U2_003655, partial [Bradymonadia bacterium]
MRIGSLSFAGVLFAAALLSLGCTENNPDVGSDDAGMVDMGERVDATVG